VSELTLILLLIERIKNYDHKQFTSITYLISQILIPITTTNTIAPTTTVHRTLQIALYNFLGNDSCVIRDVGMSAILLDFIRLLRSIGQIKNWFGGYFYIMPKKVIRLYG